MLSTVADQESVSNIIKVAAGVVQNSAGDILITKRHVNAHQGGLWEFPGGKFERQESSFRCLQRELREEVGLDITVAEPLIQIPYQYPDKQVLLDVLRVTAYTGQASGREGQALRWVSPLQLSNFEFPAANRPVITAIHLPETYLITGAYTSLEDFSERLLRALKQGCRLLQIRANDLDTQSLSKLVITAASIAKQYDARILVNADPEFVSDWPVHGVHLNSHRLLQMQQRPAGFDWVAASVHDAIQLKHAQAIGIDFAVLSPVLATTSHPHAVPIGWSTFAGLVAQAQIPIYALGGMGLEHIAQARQHGAQGIAAISQFWSGA